MLGTQEQCDVRLDHAAAATIVSVTGEVDLFAAPVLVAALDDAAARPQPILVDLTGCSFLDANGLSALLTAELHARRAHTAMLVACAPASPAARLLEVSVPGHFAAHATQGSALAALAA